MDRIFGRSKAKQPPPNLTDCIASVSKCVLICFLVSIVVKSFAIVKHLKLFI